jgi:succinylarginine dihydrolase
MLEVNFDGLIGPTHHFAGLSFGNVASTTNQGRLSNPKNAALQGLRKMKMLHDLGLKQAVIAPVCRPDFRVLRQLGMTGNPTQILQKLSAQPVQMISAFFSASSMWTANAATVSPSQDTEDQRVHITVANLISKFHRAIEPPQTFSILKAIFSKQPGADQHFVVHEPVFPHLSFGDEGAANHTRFCATHSDPGLELFVYGRKSFSSALEPKVFPARQSYEASMAVAKLHGLKEDRVVFCQQNPDAIDEGAFHNDVVAVGNRDLFFYHENAFLDESSLLLELKTKFSKLSPKPLSFLRVAAKEVSLKEAVKSYLFNSQLVTLPGGDTLLVAPIESQESSSVRTYLDSVVGKPGSPIQRVSFVDLRESMLNGGGPACLRLRVAMTEQELAHVNPGVILTDASFTKLETWIGKHYRDRLDAKELCDPKFIEEVETALDELTRILGLGSIYPFQKLSG